MAEAILFIIAEEIIRKLSSRGLEEIGLLWGVKDEIEKLRKTVSTIKAVLLDAEDQSSVSIQVQEWLSMLREALYDADDLLDDFYTETLRRQVMSGDRIEKKVRRFFSHSNQLVYDFKMGHKIKEIMDRFDEIACLKKFHLQERREETSEMRREREQTHSSLPQVVVGREEDKNNILELLCGSYFEENVSVISIVGIGGLGKTTLAQLVYNDQKVKTQFDLKLWVCVSDNFDVKLIVEKLIESVTGERCSNLEMDTLKNTLHESIIGKKYLIVLDDVWNENPAKWFRLKDLLVGGARGSRVIITTRLKRVAEITRSISIYELQGLSETESWLLFKQMAFKQGQALSPSHEAIGKEIVAKCVGVPLAIRAIGALLYFKSTESEWLSFKNKELAKVDQHGSNILPILKLSYNHLPLHLKRCFAYCRLFPKDYRINVQTLIHLWMAQGYIILPHPSQCFEEIGLAYFMDLLSMSFFQEVEKDIWGNIESCKMHDLMHDLAALVSGRESALLDSNLAYVDERTRYISIASNSDSTWEILPSLLKASKARSLLLPNGSKWGKIQKDQCHLIFSKLRYLRVLDLHDSGIETVPSSVDKLKLLRYLDLSGNERIEVLPESITGLQNLQVLKLIGCMALEQLPKDVKKLVNLRHLSLESCYSLTHMPRGIGRLTCLEKLSNFLVARDSSVSKHTGGLDELHALNNLRGALRISLGYAVKNGASASDFEAANLKEKQHLLYLSLDWSRLENDVDDGENNVDIEEMSLEKLRPHPNLRRLLLWDYRGMKTPSWFPSLRNLVGISFFNCKNIQRLPSLDVVPSLEALEIEESINLEYIDTEEGSTLFFPSLKHLLLRNCPNLKGWQRCNRDNRSAAELLPFPCLSDLEIHSCRNLTSIPPLPCLEKLRLEKASMRSLEQILKLTISVSGSSSSASHPSSLSPAVSQLKSLTIWEIEDLEFPPVELLPSFTSLQEVSIFDCSRLSTTASEDENDNNEQWKCLQSLRTLSLVGIPELVALPNGLQHVAALQTLIIERCDNLMSLPEWMANLTGLQYLSIYAFSGLDETWRNNMVEDWHKISHIPNIQVNFTQIQQNGLYQR
ncbi:hypothetical protein P3X46_013439 [Hevea brasiliensis]|uniref:Disease resistance protein RGA3 n=1 Tax=Hevea brasiliensis TaxID=3981 RepID=A0ABQ9M5B6_HEVBR|nr:putative disease resistance protein RGA3 [Hevea brasiliensis]KAJ9174838.1 hypothetical protein P3X46_013439 [Hevea brasiliensis]